MPDKQVTMTLKATDGASKVFKAVGQSGDAMGKQVAQAAQTASRGLEQMDQSASRAGQGLGQYRDNLQQVGLGLGALGGLLAVSGQSFRNQEVQIEALRRGYGDAADDLIKFTESLQDTTNFSNDAGVAAANIFRTLSENYGFTADQIQQLITVSADLAASQGIGLADAAMRVQSAMRGEAESAEYLGLTLNDSALGIDRLSMSVGQNERAQIRFIALQDQASFAMGTAQQQAEGTYGTMANLRDSVNDNAQALGDFLGPFGEIGAFAADNALQIGLMSLALGQMGKGVKAVNDLSMAMTGLNVAKLSLTGITTLMTGPAGIIIAATLAGAAIKEFTGGLGPSFADASDSAIASVDALIAKVVELGDTSALADVVLGLDTIVGEQTKLNDEAKTGASLLQSLTAEIQSYSDGLKETVDDGMMLASAAFDELTQSQKDFLDENGNGIVTIEESQRALEAWSAQAEKTAEVVNGLESGSDELAEIFAMTGKGAAFAKSEALAYTEALIAGTFSASAYEQALDSLITGYGNQEEAALAVKAAEEEKAAAAEANTNIYSNQTDGILEHTSALKIQAEQERLNASAAEFTATINEIAADASRGRADASILITDAAKEEAAATMLAASAARTKAEQDEIAADAAAKRAAGEKAAAEAELARLNAAQERPGQGSYGSMVAAADAAAEAIKQRFVDAFESIATAPQALENGFRVIVGNTNAIADSADSVAKWAAEMTDAAEGMSKLDSILDSNSVGLSAATINQEEYNAAQEAFRDIQRENVEIAQDVAVIQAKQAPILAELMAGTENYMQKIAEMDGIQQTAALGFMDSAESAQALQLQMLALDAASGALGTNGRQWASGIIEGAAMADPVLKAMLLDMGLISEGADGTITVNFDDNATSPLQQIVAAVQELNETTLLLVAILDDDPFTNTAKDVEDKMNSIGEMEQYPIVGVNDQTDTPIRKIITNMAAVGSITETPTVNLQDNASGGLANVKNLLDSLYDKTIYVNTVGTVSGSFGPSAQLADGGVIPQAAHGRAIKGKAIVGEAGWEMIDAPGGFVTPHTASVQDMKAKSGINLNLTIEGNIYGIDDLVSQVVDVVTPALGRALDIQRRSLSA